MEPQANPDPAISLLLVEDDEATLHCLGIILAKRYPHVAVATADNGRAGLELFQARPAGVVVTDFNMPEMCGSHMVDEIRAIKPDTKFIVITGDSGIHALEDSAKKGFTFDHFIAKPVVFQELFGAIDQCLGEIAQQTEN